MSAVARLGFIGLGAMGEPMCRNLARKSGLPVAACDLRPEPLRRLEADGVRAAASAAELGAEADLVFLSLPGGPEVEAAADGLLAAARPGLVVADCSTAPMTLARELAERFAAAGAAFVDSPVARTRAAARAGTLCAMVGGEAAAFARVRPFLACFATDIVHCGAAGAGQLAKAMNNMVLMQTVNALAEALTAARRLGVDGETLFAALGAGSADSFALRNHGMKALLPGDFPERAHSCLRALKDLDCAFAAAAAAGTQLRGAEAVRGRLREAVDMGLGGAYYPALIAAIDRREPDGAK